MKNISFNVNGRNVQGTLFEPKNNGRNPGLLCIHGWTSRQDRYFTLGQAAADQGYVALTIDLPGHGLSEGKLEDLSRREFLDGAVGAYDFLAALPTVDADNITVIGSSFGGYMTAVLSEERPCAAIGLRAPADYPDEGFDESHYTRAHSFYIDVEEEKAKWRTEIHDASETKALRAVHSFAGPIMIIESENDEVMPQPVLTSYATAVAEKERLTYVVMKGAPHSLSSDPARVQEYIDITLAWMKSRA